MHALKSIAHMEKPKRIWKVIRTEMCMTKTPIQIIWKVIRTEMCMTKTLIQRNGSHSYRNVHDENPFKKKW